MIGDAVEPVALTTQMLRSQESCTPAFITRPPRLSFDWWVINWTVKNGASQGRSLSLALVMVLYLASRTIAEAPSVSSFYPTGVQRGQSTDVTINGKSGTAPVQAWTLSDALTLAVSEDGKTLNVSAAETAEPGLHWIRIYNAEGASDLRPFFVGVLPELTESEPNNSHDELSETSLPAVVNGILNRNGDVDTYAVALEPGQTLIASVEANRSLSSPMDGVLQVLSPEGSVLEQNDDDHGFDPQLVFTADEPGVHFVRVFGFPAEPNSSIRFAGDDDYIYRLTLTTGPFIDHVSPGDSGSGLLSVTGWNLPADWLTREDAVQIPGLHWIRSFESGGPAISESDAAAGELPLRIIGHIGARGEVDAFDFVAEKDQSLRIAVRARVFEGLLDPMLRICDADGKELEEDDDAGRNEFDPAITWKAPADGTYTVEVRDRFGHGGPRYVYDLSVAPESPRVGLEVEDDHFKVKPGDSIEIEVTVNRRGGYDMELQIAADGLPEGVTCAAVTSPGEGDASKSVKVKLEAAGEIAFNGPLRIVASDGEGEVGVATTELPLSGARTESLWLTVGP